MVARDTTMSEQSRTRLARPRKLPTAAYAVALFLVCAGLQATEGALLARISNNGTYGSCMDCRIAEDLELEMLLVEDVYYGSAHVGRMLATGKGTGTGGTGKRNQGACSGKRGQPKNCSPEKNSSKKNCASPFDRSCSQ